jgi:hypothetical protein
MSTAVTSNPRPRPRHALNLPAGSVRTLLALGVLGTLWVTAVFTRPDETGHVKLPIAFIYLNYLMALILAHFFTAHGKTIGSVVSDRSPLGLPAGTARLVLIGGYIGLAYFLYQRQVDFEPAPMGDLALLVGLMLGAYFLGHLLSGIMRFLGGGVLPAWYQDFEAWVSLLAMIAMGVLSMVHLVINTHLPLEDRLDMGTVEAVLAALVGFYFGARS